MQTPLVPTCLYLLDAPGKRAIALDTQARDLGAGMITDENSPQTRPNVEVVATSFLAPVGVSTVKITKLLTRGWGP